MEGDEQSEHGSVANPDDEWPYDPAWVELAEPPLERLRQAAARAATRQRARYPAAPTKSPMIAP